MRLEPPHSLLNPRQINTCMHSILIAAETLEELHAITLWFCALQLADINHLRTEQHNKAAEQTMCCPVGIVTLCQQKNSANVVFYRLVRHMLSYENSMAALCSAPWLINETNRTKQKQWDAIFSALNTLKHMARFSFSSELLDLSLIHI